MLNIQTPFLAANQTLLASGQSPVTAVGDNLLTFLANRLSMSFTNLSCKNFGLTDPVTVTLDGNGAATAATFNTAQQGATSTGQTSAGGAGLPRPRDTIAWAVAITRRWTRRGCSEPRSHVFTESTPRGLLGHCRWREELD